MIPVLLEFIVRSKKDSKEIKRHKLLITVYDKCCEINIMIEINEMGKHLVWLRIPMK